MIGTGLFQASRRTTATRGRSARREQREQLPDEAPDKAGVSEGALFFREAAESLEGVCHDVFYINYGFV
jgi:hypothetical protein